VNNAAQQDPRSSIEDISAAQLKQTFRVNVFGYVFLTQAALVHLSEGGCIVNTGSVTAERGSRALADYAATKGAEALTYLLAQQLAERQIRVHGVAPAFVYLACADTSYVTGQFIHVNGGGRIG
jgi:NAD(P)-dependent dehydrogenase (short-subunit alcohol dehydrogenase family)